MRRSCRSHFLKRWTFTEPRPARFSGSRVWGKRPSSVCLSSRSWKSLNLERVWIHEGKIHEFYPSRGPSSTGVTCISWPWRLVFLGRAVGGGAGGRRGEQRQSSEEHNQTTSKSHPTHPVLTIPHSHQSTLLVSAVEKENALPMFFYGHTSDSVTWLALPGGTYLDVRWVPLHRTCLSIYRKDHRLLGITRCPALYFVWL